MLKNSGQGKPEVERLLHLTADESEKDKVKIDTVSQDPAGQFEDAGIRLSRISQPVI